MVPATARRELLPRYRPPPPAVRKRHHALPTGADLTALADPDGASCAAASRACQPTPACAIVPAVATPIFLILIVARFSS